MTIQQSVVQSKRDKILLSDGLISIAVLIPFILHLTSLRGLAVYWVAAISPVIFFVFFYRARNVNYLLGFFTFAVFLLSSSFFIFIFKGNLDSLVFSYSILSSIALSKVLLLRPCAALFSSKLVLIVVYLWYFYSVFSIGSTPEHANSYLHELSRNHVSLLLLLVCWFYYSTRFFYNKKYSLIPIVILFLASIQLYGRTGIALSFLSLLLVFFHFLLVYKGYKLSFVFFIGLLFFCLAFFLLLLFYNDTVKLTSIVNQTNFANGIESPRGTMVKEYLNNIQVSEFLIGRDMSLLPIISSYDGNPHNTFIRGHSFFGVSFIIFVFYFYFLSFHKLFFCFSIKRLFILSVSVLFLIRAYFDSIFFVSFFDFILIYFFYISVKDSPVKC